MKSFFKWLLILSIGLVLLLMLAGGSLWSELISGPGVSISINGEDLDFGGLSDVPWYSAIFGMLVAGVVVCILLPLVLLFSLGLPLLLLGLTLVFVFIGTIGLGSLLFSPLILLVLLLWLIFRNKRPQQPRPAKPASKQASMHG
ncbi:MAG: hypothetical protein IV107_01550 [Paucibacter sp.]|nr:hypothetical protein [Roseateles sp.]